MKLVRRLALVTLVLVYLACLGADLLAPAGYATQHRESPNAPPGRAFLLGTDELGRDLLARLLHGGRISLLLAPAAALLSTFLATLAGLAAGLLGGWPERAFARAIDVSMSLPWLFLLLSIRAILPLNVQPLESLLIMFLLLGILSWDAAARVVLAGTRSLRTQDFVIHARVCGVHGWRLVWRHMLPNLRPLFVAQFWISVPYFILTEANLGLLGLGVGEPLPSWGNLLRGLESLPALADAPWLLAPLVLLVISVGCFHLLAPMEESHT